MNRCKWTNLETSNLYINYHDTEWGVPSYDDNYLFEMLILESFHCGLSWLIILNKREAFRSAFDSFIPETIANYNESKVESLLKDSSIVRHRGKILASIENAKSFIKIQKEFGSFSNYIWSFTDNAVLHYPQDTYSNQKNDLSDKVSKDLKKRGFKFMGSVTTYSYLGAVGVMNNHASYCFLHR